MAGSSLFVKSLDSLRCWAEINLSALAFNLQRIRSLLPSSCGVIGVIKADAYGHGLFQIAQTLATPQTQTLAGANMVEAEIASRAVPRTDLLLLCPLLPSEIAEAVHRPRWFPTLSNQEEFEAFEKAARRYKKRIRVQIKLDTGMGRLGGFPNEILLLLQRINLSRWIRAAGLYTHLASADNNLHESLQQIKRLYAFCREVVYQGGSIPPLHFQNSAGTLRISIPQPIYNVRPGLALYGIPIPLRAWQQRFGQHPLQPVLSWKTRVALVRQVPKGTRISYGGTFRTQKQTRIAVLSAGYADGISRKLSNRGEVLIHSNRCRILGRVTMDMIIADITRISKTRWGDTVTLIGKNGQEEITANEMAQWAETIPYEILCNISKRVPRISVHD